MRLKVADCQPATLLKMNFFIGIFQVNSLQISEHLFSRTPLKGFCRGVFRTLSRRSFFVNIMNSLKSLIIFTKKLHLRCFTKFCVCLSSEVISSIYQMCKFKAFCHSFWRNCNVFDVVFAHINETLCSLSFCAIVYHRSKEDVKCLSYLDVEYYSFHNNIIGFIIALLVSYVWKVCNETMLPFADSIFLDSLFTRHFNSQY